MDDDSWAPTKASPGRKDTKRWCRGKAGREHVPSLAMPSWASSWKQICGPPPEWWWDVPIGRRQLRRGDPCPAWWCKHREVCSTCGKVLRYKVLADECPDRG